MLLPCSAMGRIRCATGNTMVATAIAASPSTIKKSTEVKITAATTNLLLLLNASGSIPAIQLSLPFPTPLQLLFCSVLLQVMALWLAPTWLLTAVASLYLGLLRPTQAGAYYGIKQMPPQVPQYQPLGQQVPHMPLGKDGVPMQHMAKEGPHLPYGKEYVPQYIKEIPQIPMLGKKGISKKGKGNIGKT